MLKAVLASVLLGLAWRGAAQQCGGVLTAPGTFASPGFPQPYPSNLRCEWEIVVERGIRVSLQFLDQFAVEQAANCSKDAVVIFDWRDERYIEIARLCGEELPSYKLKYISTFNKMKVVLETDKETNLLGFQAEWTTTCSVLWQEPYLATDTEQFLYSPGFPNYWPNMTCSYRIEILQVRDKEGWDLIVPHRKKGMFKIISLELEDKSHPYYNMESYDCVNDYITLEYNNRHEKYCGIRTTFSETYFTEKLDVNFKSNEAIEKKGFVISYSIYKCGGRITEPTTITASNLPRYPDDTNCTWTIEAPENKKVMVKFAYLNMNHGLFCKYTDHVNIYDGPLIDPEKQLASVCGNTNAPFTIPAFGNTMTIMFESFREGRGFSADVIFTDLESTGCGGIVNMTYLTSYSLTSPKTTTNSEDSQNCLWNILAPEDFIVKIQFTSLSLPECAKSSNQNFLEVRDGVLPDTLVLGSYCGGSLPPPVSSSSASLSVGWSAPAGSEFTATVTVKKSLCKPTVVEVSDRPTRLVSPGYESGSLARGINCAYEIRHGRGPIQLTLRNLDIQPSTTPGVCNKDKIIICFRSAEHTLGKDYNILYRTPFYIQSNSEMENIFDYTAVNTTHQYEFCGFHEVIELYLPRNFFINLITTPESDSQEYKGLEIEVNVPNFCYKNYTEPYGRIIGNLEYTEATYRGDRHECFTLITAPEGHTVSAYFITFDQYSQASDDVYLNIYDGSSPEFSKITTRPAFSTGRYLLLHHSRVQWKSIHYDLNYVTTNKGRGCGGYLSGDQGMVTSPLYPEYYGENVTCVWELETPPATQLRLRIEIEIFATCDEMLAQVRLRARDGRLLAMLCHDRSYHYFREIFAADNYMKIEFYSAKGYDDARWRAWFSSVSPN